MHESLADSNQPKSEFELLKERMQKLAAADQPRELQMQQQLHGLFAGKNCVSHITNPRVEQERVYLQTNNYLVFDITISGDVAS